MTSIKFQVLDLQRELKRRASTTLSHESCISDTFERISKAELDFATDLLIPIVADDATLTTVTKVM